MNPKTQRSLAVGRGVALFALMLAGLRTGLRGLPTELKIDPEKGLTRAWLEFGARRVVDWLAGTSILEFGAEVEYRRHGVLRGEWRIKDEDRQVMARFAEFDPDLERLHSLGRGLGFELEETEDGGLVTEVGDRGRLVKLSVHGEVGSNSRTVRFCSTLRDASPKQPTKVTARAIPESADHLLEMLVLNSDLSTNCRIGIDGDSGVPMVLEDQLLATLDVQEYRRHLTHVAEVADRWCATHPPKFVKRAARRSKPDDERSAGAAPAVEDRGDDGAR